MEMTEFLSHDLEEESHMPNKNSHLGLYKNDKLISMMFKPLFMFRFNYYCNNGHLNNIKVVFGKWSASVDFTHPSSSLKISYLGAPGWLSR